MDSPERRASLARSAKRLVKLLQEGAPDILIARECVNVFRHGLATFEHVAGELFTNWLIRGVRVNCHQCVQCGGQLDERVSGAPSCRTCKGKEAIDFVMDDLAHGADAIEFDVDKLD